MTGLGGKREVRVFSELAAPEGVELSELCEVVVIDSSGGIEARHAIRPDVDGRRRLVVQFAILLTGSEARLDRDRNRRRKFLGYVERGTHVLIPTHPRIVIVGIVLDIAELGGIGAGGLRDRGIEPVERVEAFDDGKPDVAGPIPHDSVPGIV